jgi:hypothetical protein
LGVVSPVNPDAASYLAGVNCSIGLTSLCNSAGNPAMSVPLHWRAVRRAVRRRGDVVPARGGPTVEGSAAALIG